MGGREGVGGTDRVSVGGTEGGFVEQILKSQCESVYCSAEHCNKVKIIYNVNKLSFLYRS